jgi:hypothetical protein
MAWQPEAVKRSGRVHAQEKQASFCAIYRKMETIIGFDLK